MADAAGREADERLAGPRALQVDGADGERGAEFLEYRGTDLHGAEASRNRSHKAAAGGYDRRVFDKFRRLKDPVAGQAQVVAASRQMEHAVYASCAMVLIISAPGIEPFKAEQSSLVKTSRWPHTGMVLPCTVDRANPGRFKIEWDAVPTGSERADQLADQMLAGMQGQGGQAGGAQVFGIPGGQVQVHNLSGDPDAIKKAEAMMGMDLDGDGVVGGAAAAAEEDPLDKIERLAQLRDRGVITEDEFQEQKQRLLGQL